MADPIAQTLPIPNTSLKYGKASVSGPSDYILKIGYFLFPLIAYWLFASTLDKSRTFFERRGYVKVVSTILFAKILFAVSAIGFVVFCLVTKRM